MFLSYFDVGLLNINEKKHNKAHSQVDEEEENKKKIKKNKEKKKMPPS